AIELVATNYTVTEGAGAALLMVRRTGNTSGSVSAGYAATSGTAQAGTDFVATNGAVVFGPGETSKVIQIPVIDDAQAEADEIFTVTLGNPIGGIVLGSNVVAAVTIVDNDSIPNFTAITPLFHESQ
ncbi:MAG: aggregation factor core protein MAFp3, isoform C, partial [Verrucomicrobia bacterium]